MFFQKKSFFSGICFQKHKLTNRTCFTANKNCFFFNDFEGIKEIDLIALDAKVVSNQAMFLACVLQTLLPELHKLEGFLTPKDVEEVSFFVALFLQEKPTQK